MQTAAPETEAEAQSAPSEAEGNTEATREEVTPEQLLPAEAEAELPTKDEARLKAIIEAIVYLTDQPLTVAQIAAALSETAERVAVVLQSLVEEYEKPEHGIAVREVAGGFAMATKAEHHDEVRQFVKNLQPPVKLSLAALETLSVIAYKQPITAPEIMEVRGVQGAGVLKTLLDRKLISAAGRKNVVGKPILYKTTREFLVQFGLKDLSELPSLKEFEEIGRLSIPDEPPAPEPEAEAAAPAEAAPPEEPVEPEESNGA
jgi:segregation and condensation protein B